MGSPLRAKIVNQNKPATYGPSSPRKAEGDLPESVSRSPPNSGRTHLCSQARLQMITRMRRVARQAQRRKDTAERMAEQQDLNASFPYLSAKLVKMAQQIYYLR